MDKLGAGPDKFRFAIAILIPLIIITISVGLFIQKISDEILTTQKELQGAHKVQSFYQVIRLTQDLRGLRLMEKAGATGLEQIIENRKNTLLHSLDSSAAEQHAGWLGVRSSLKYLNGEVRRLSELEGSISDMELFDYYSQVNHDSMLLLETIVDS